MDLYLPVLPGRVICCYSKTHLRARQHPSRSFTRPFRNKPYRIPYRPYGNNKKKRSLFPGRLWKDRIQIRIIQAEAALIPVAGDQGNDYAAPAAQDRDTYERQHLPCHKSYIPPEKEGYNYQETYLQMCTGKGNKNY